MPVRHIVVDRSFVGVRAFVEIKDSRGIAVGAFINLVLNCIGLGNLALLDSDTGLYCLARRVRAVHGVLDLVFFVDGEFEGESASQFIDNLVCCVRVGVFIADVAFAESDLAVGKIRKGDNPHFIWNAERNKTLLAASGKVNCLVKQLEFIVLFEVFKFWSTAVFFGRILRCTGGRFVVIFLCRRGTCIVFC